MARKPLSVSAASAVDAAFVTSLAHDVVAGLKAVDAAKAQLSNLSGARLPLLVARLAGAEAVTEAAWARDWAPAFTTALEGSGRYSKDAKGRYAGIAPAVSNYKVAVVCLTNGIEPGAGDSFESYVREARKEANKTGLIKASTAGAKSKGEERASPQRQASQEKVAQAAAFALADKDKDFANKLKMAAGPLRDEFEDWIDTLLAVRAARDAKRK